MPCPPTAIPATSGHSQFVVILLDQETTILCCPAKTIKTRHTSLESFTESATV